MASEQDPDGDNVSAVTDLAERLGYGPEDRLLIVSCDDLGLCHAANIGVYEALRSGVATSAALMVPAPWAREAAERYRGEDIGVHLTLTAQFDLYRWGPITHAPSLLDGDGGFPRTVMDAWEHADPDEVRRECRAQIERAILWGFDASHLDSHMSVLQRRPEMFDIYLDMAIECQLPIRLPDESDQRAIGFPFRRLAAEEGVLFPDRVIRIEDEATAEWALSDLGPGVTEIHLFPADDTGELRAITDSWEQRVLARDLITGGRLKALIDGAGAMLIGYRELREAQRQG